MCTNITTTKGEDVERSEVIPGGMLAGVEPQTFNLRGTYKNLEELQAPTWLIEYLKFCGMEPRPGFPLVIEQEFYGTQGVWVAKIKAELSN